MRFKNDKQRKAVMRKMSFPPSIYVYRVPYGKADTKEKDKEYKAKGGSPVGNQEEWIAYAKSIGRPKVIFIDGDRRIERGVKKDEIQER